jgi:hypothetical protein
MKLNNKKVIILASLLVIPMIFFANIPLVSAATYEEYHSGEIDGGTFYTWTNSSKDAVYVNWTISNPSEVVDVFLFTWDQFITWYSYGIPYPKDVPAVEKAIDINTGSFVVWELDPTKNYTIVINKTTSLTVGYYISITWFTETEETIPGFEFFSLTIGIILSVSLVFYLNRRKPIKHS